MAEPGRLDDLKRKFEENPRRYFAPLANEYRKAGATDRAVELCRTYLPDQPGHMSGYIVYGQALFDAGRHDEAAAVFRQALTLDPENMIALRHLGDIARAADDRAGAMQWYGKVLELDPRNEEISAAITALATPGQGRPRRQAAPFHPIRPEPEAPGDLALDRLVSEPDRPQAPPDVSRGPVEAPPPPHVEHEWVAPAAEDGDDEWGDSAWGQGQDQLDRSVEPSIREELSVEEPWAGEPADDAAEEADLLLPPPPIVTETVAELYAEQGLTLEALAVYRELVLTRDEPRWHARMAELEALVRPASRGAEERAPAGEEYARDEAASDEPASDERATDEPAGGGHAADLEASSEGASRVPRPPGETIREFFARIGQVDIVAVVAHRPETGGLGRLFDETQLAEGDARAAASLAAAFAARDDRR